MMRVPMAPSRDELHAYVEAILRDSGSSTLHGRIVDLCGEVLSERSTSARHREELELVAKYLVKGDPDKAMEILRPYTEDDEPQVAEFDDDKRGRV